MDIKIGKKVLIKSISLLIPEQEEAVINFDFDGNLHTYIIKFSIDQDAKNENKRFLKFIGEENSLTMDFVNWDVSVRTTSTPVEVGESDNGDKVYIIAMVQKADSLYKMDLQIMRDENNER